MPARASLSTHAQHPRLQADIIINDNETVRLRLVVIHDGADAFAACIHEGLRLYEEDAVSFNKALSDQGFVGVFGYANAAAGGQRVKRHETGVMAGVFIWFARVSQAGYYIHIIGSPFHSCVGLSVWTWV